MITLQNSSFNSHHNVQNVWILGRRRHYVGGNLLMAVALRTMPRTMSLRLLLYSSSTAKELLLSVPLHKSPAAASPRRRHRPGDPPRG